MGYASGPVLNLAEVEFQCAFRSSSRLWVRAFDCRRSVDRPGVDRFVGVHELDVAVQHFAQRIAAVERLEPLVDAVERLGLPFRAVLPGRTPSLDRTE